MALLALEQSVIVSIDFGTHGFFVSYCEFDNPGAPTEVDDWKQMPAEYKKNLSTILLDRSNPDNILAIGYDAHFQFVEARDNSNTIYFKNFKLQLMKQHCESFDTNRLISSVDNHSSRAICPLVSQLLSEIVEHTLSFYQRVHGDMEIVTSEVLWVLTVPAIWSEESREAMKRCCEDPIVGIPRDNILVLSEPEAAGSYVLWKTDEGRELAPRDRYICVDIGAGTFDVVCYELGADRTLLEFHHTDGGLCGSVDVDEEFIGLLKQILGEDLMEEYQRDHPADFVDTMMNFQIARENLRLDLDQALVRLGGELSDLARDRGLDLTVRCQEQQIGYRRGNLVLVKEIWMRLHSAVVSTITEKIRTILSNINEEAQVSTIFLVGGFSKSPYIQQGIRNMLERHHPNIRIVTELLHPERAVCSGALWAAAKRPVQKRLLPFTYGISVTKPWRRGDPKDRRVMDENLNVFVIPNWFHCLFRKGQKYKVGDEAEFKCKIPEETRELDVNILKSEERYPTSLYTNDEAFSVAMRYSIGANNLDLPNGEHDLKMCLTFTEDGVELKVHVGDQVFPFPMEFY